MALIDSLMIMLRPMIGQYLKPLEENGTIAKMQSQIQTVTARNAIPELAEFIESIREHNSLLREIRDGMNGRDIEQSDRYIGDLFEPGSHPGTGGLVHDNGTGMLAATGAD